jgi:hypothetical protein
MEHNIIHFLSFSKNEIYLKIPTNDIQTRHALILQYVYGFVEFHIREKFNKNKYNNQTQNPDLNYLRFAALFFFLIVFDRLRCVFLRLCILGFRVPPL